MQNVEQYLNDKVRTVFDPIISKLLLEKPEDPVKFFFIKLDSIYVRFSNKVIRKKSY